MYTCDTRVSCSCTSIRCILLIETLVSKTVRKSNCRSQAKRGVRRKARVFVIIVVKLGYDSINIIIVMSNESTLTLAQW